MQKEGGEGGEYWWQKKTEMSFLFQSIKREPHAAISKSNDDDSRSAWTSYAATVRIGGLSKIKTVNKIKRYKAVSFDLLRYKKMR